MREIDILWELPPSSVHFSQKSWEKLYLNYLQSILESSGAPGWAISVTLCDDGFIRKLNREFRGKDEATDVLSFVENPEDRPDLEKTEGIILGDSVISLDTLRENAAYFGVSENEEFKRITLHGVLHLQGWDHNSNDSTEPMLIEQEKILEKYSGVKII